MEKPVLFEWFPQAAENIPFIPMGDYPTPVQKLEKLGAKLGCSDLWVKRDDLSSKKMGGNKVRIMEFLLAEAAAKGKKVAVSPGALGSNQIMASAIYAKDLGIKVVGVFFKQCDTDYMCKHMLIDKSMGVEFNHVSSPYMVPFAIIYHYLKNVDWPRMEAPFYIPTFGSSATCAVGYVNAMIELKQQIDQGLIPEPDYIFVTAGTGGTMAGIHFGAKMLGLKTKVVGVRIADWIAINEFVVASILKRLHKHLRQSGIPLGPMQFSAKEVELIHEFFGGEYARITEEGVEAKKTAEETEGIILDTTYTAKTMAAMMKYISDNQLQDKKILFWHTYNTQDLTPFIDGAVCHWQLPPEFQCYFEGASA